MDELLTDDQEVDRAKNWLRENGSFLAAGVILGLGGLFGWQQWQDYKTARAGEASIIWEQFRGAIAGERLNEVTETLELLEADFATTPYMDQARLAMARMYMDRIEPEPAAEQLRLLIAETSDINMRRIGELRLAQILLFQQQFDEALAVLPVTDESAFAGQYHELRGDIFYEQGKLAEASDAYRMALAQPANGTINRAYVQMKLDATQGSLAEVAAAVDAAMPAEQAPAADSTDE